METATQTKERKRSGGPAFHKPGCKCRPCAAKSRNREEEANPRAAGTGGTDLVAKAQEGPLNADPILVASGRSARDRIAHWILRRSQGMKNTEIAAEMHIQPGTLNTLISKASRQGWLVFDSPAERLEHELAPLIVDNVKEFLGSSVTEGNKLKMTIEAAKGIGLFKAHQAVKVENDSPSMVLALKFETAPNNSIEVVEGTIVGKPRFSDG